MRWIKRARGKAGLAVAGMLLLLVLVVWVPVSASGAYDRASGLATLVTGTVQATPTIDATFTTLSKEQLTLQVKQLQNQLQNQNNWFFSNSTGIIAAFSANIIALFGLYQWGENRKDERNKEEYAKNKDLKDKAEARFQAAVTGLGDEKEGAKIGAAILLRTFLRPGYEQFYTQTFDLAVANLRLPRTPHISEDPDGGPYQPKDGPRVLMERDTTISQCCSFAFSTCLALQARG